MAHHPTDGGEPFRARNAEKILYFDKSLLYCGCKSSALGLTAKV